MDPKKFDAARAHVLDAPPRERQLPTGAVIALCSRGLPTASRTSTPSTRT